MKSYLLLFSLRKKLCGYIDTMPEKNLAILKPLLSALAEPLYTIEPASPEESKKAAKYIREYYKDPSSFVPFKITKTPQQDLELAKKRRDMVFEGGNNQ